MNKVEQIQELQIQVKELYGLLSSLAGAFGLVIVDGREVEPSYTSSGVAVYPLGKVLAARTVSDDGRRILTEKFGQKIPAI